MVITTEGLDICPICELEYYGDYVSCKCSEVQTIDSDTKFADLVKIVAYHDILPKQRRGLRLA
jgi:hypothetical protein